MQSYPDKNGVEILLTEISLIDTYFEYFGELVTCTFDARKERETADHLHKDTTYSPVGGKER